MALAIGVEHSPDGVLIHDSRDGSWPLPPLSLPPPAPPPQPAARAPTTTTPFGPLPMEVLIPWAATTFLAIRLRPHSPPPLPRQDGT